MSQSNIVHNVYFNKLSCPRRIANFAPFHTSRRSERSPLAVSGDDGWKKGVEVTFNTNEDVKQ